MDDGNEGFMYIYNKGTIGVLKGIIGHEDVGPIASQYVRNAGVPSKATGYPKPIYDGPIYELISFRSKEIQLLNYLNYLDGGDRSLNLIIGKDIGNKYQDREIMTSLIEDYPDYLEKLSKNIEIIETPKYVYLVLLIWLLLIVSMFYQTTSEDILKFGLLCIEHFFVILFGGLTGRVERCLFWPLVMFHVGNLVYGLVKNFSYKRLYELPYDIYKSSKVYAYTLSNVKMLKFVDIKPIIAILNIVMMVFSHYNFFVDNKATFYWLHYLTFAIIFLLDIKTYSRL